MGDIIDQNRENSANEDATPSCRACPRLAGSSSACWAARCCVGSLRGRFRYGAKWPGRALPLSQLNRPWI